jgi:rhodanese-related sulfurtransferase
MRQVRRSGEDHMTSALEELDAPTVKARLDRGEAVLIDVREPDEHARERIPGARLMPLSSFDPMRIAGSGAHAVILHCASGARSARAAAMLAGVGLSDVAHLKGGINAWKHAGFPVALDRKAPLPIMRQVQMLAGSLVVLGVVLGFAVHPGFFGLSAFVGAGLVMAGVTGWCGMATLLGKLPYNRGT